ncbi:MAG TPA: DUF4331 domain-containing protein [Nevskiaceae bacterium]|nr:DUF4331 domain-containing protein [Nevskiaceae bacterium]
MRLPFLRTALALALAGAAVAAQASSHREAPFITETPKVDGTDFYMFRSYEAGREGFVTLLANYIPLQDSYGGPNYFSFDPDAVYEIHIDNNGDANEDLTYQFRFRNLYQGIALDVGPAGNTQSVAIPLINAGQIGPNRGDIAALNLIENYSITQVRGDRRTGTAEPVVNVRTGKSNFRKPVDNIGNKSIPDYPAYAASHIFPISVPGCSTEGRVFVGQRKEGFVVNLGETFDLINLNPLGPVDGEANTIDDKNISTIALELPISCLTAGNETVIGAWTTASLPARRVLRGNGSAGERGDLVQVSRLGMPLVNEVVIGLPDKDLFNASEPSGDGQFATYVTNPTLPELIEILFKDALQLQEVAPNNFPRQDLIAAFLTGVPGLNQPANVVASEMLRLNTAIAPVAASQQDNLGLLGGDNAGFPNGRRPGDDVVDIELRVAMGVVCHAFPGAFCNPEDAPVGNAPITDGAFVDASAFDESFPYLKSPIPGSPN